MGTCESKYINLAKEFPEYISLNQLYKICKIAKRSALYLGENRVIPCIVNHKNKTWRYKIHINDVMKYLDEREKIGSMIPRGAVNSGYSGSRKIRKSGIFSSDRKTIKAYYRHLFSSCPDTLSTADASKLLGISIKSIRSFIKLSKLKAIMCERVYLIPKIYLLDFVVTDDYLRFTTPNKKFKEKINNFDKWCG